VTITTPAAAEPRAAATFDERRRIASRVFRGALAFNAALTAFWLFAVLTRTDTIFFRNYDVDGEAIRRVAAGVFFFYILWGFIWYGIKNLLLKFVAGFSKEERRRVFQSRMNQPFDVAELVARHSERRIRIIDMIGRRGRFITLGMAFFFYLYAQVGREQNPTFATAFLGDSLFDAIATGWIFLAFYYANGLLGAAFYGPQSRIMDGVLARANCLLIVTLWGLFKFVLVPIGGQLAALFQPAQFAVVFALIWGSYMVTDTLAEVGGSLFGRQRIRVWGIGDVNRKSVAGIVTGLTGCLIFNLWIVLANGLPGAWIALAVTIAISNTLLELFSPRGTDDFTMATANALICWAFGALLLT
jgi:hypothetical protein